VSPYFQKYYEKEKKPKMKKIIIKFLLKDHMCKIRREGREEVISIIYI
jgi:hypothetical protein